MKTENKLFDALDRIASGNSKFTNGKLSQENVAKEAGVSRATFNRYQGVVDEFNRLKDSGRSGENLDSPLTIQDKNKELQQVNIELRRVIASDKKEHKELVDKARQEIYLLNRSIENKDEDIASLKRKLAISESKSSERIKLIKK